MIVFLYAAAIAYRLHFAAIGLRQPSLLVGFADVYAPYKGSRPAFRQISCSRHTHPAVLGCPGNWQ